MLIVNKTDLCYQYLGWVIDKIQEEDKGQTHYYGEIDISSFCTADDREIHIEIHYLKRYTKFIFYERN